MDWRAPSIAARSAAAFALLCVLGATARAEALPPPVQRSAPGKPAPRPAAAPAKAPTAPATLEVTVLDPAGHPVPGRS